MGKVIDHVSPQTPRHVPPACGIFSHRSPELTSTWPAVSSISGPRAFTGNTASSDRFKTTVQAQSSGLPWVCALPERNRVCSYTWGPETCQGTPKRTKQAYSHQLYPTHRWVPLNSNLPVIGTLPDHFAKSVRLARNSQHSHHPASESQIRATWMLQDAAVVANCNTYNRNQPIRELRKGLFFRGRYYGAGIDSTSESFRTAFHTIYDLTGVDETGDRHWYAIQISDNPRHAPSVQC